MKKLIQKASVIAICALFTTACTTVNPYTNEKQTSKIVFRAFRPKVNSPISLLIPAHRPQSQLAKAFCSLLVTEIEKMINSMTNSNTQ